MQITHWYQSSYTIRVKNPTKGTARKVRTCDNLPAGLVYVSSKAETIGPHQTKRYLITVRVLPGASGNKVNHAAVAGSGVKGTARAKRPVRVLPAAGAGGGVTG